MHGNDCPKCGASGQSTKSCSSCGAVSLTPSARCNKADNNDMIVLPQLSSFAETIRWMIDDDGHEHKELIRVVAYGIGGFLYIIMVGDGLYCMVYGWRYIWVGKD